MKALQKKLSVSASACAWLKRSKAAVARATRSRSASAKARSSSFVIGCTSAALREHELAGVEELGHQPLADLEDLLVGGGVGAEPRARRPVARAVGRVALEQRQRRHHVALALGHLLAIGVEHPARDRDVAPRHAVLVQQALRDRVEGPGADDLVALRAQVGRDRACGGAPGRAPSASRSAASASW